MTRSTWMKATVVLGMTLASAVALAQPAGGPGPGPGPGGAGPGMMRGYGAGAPADCYHYRGGPGAWGGGPGAMRGYGAGPGWGPGSGGPLSQLDLSADQEQKIAGIHEDLRRKTWDTMGQLQSERFKLRSLYMADKPDPNAIADQEKKVDELRRTMIKARVEASNQMRAVLTKEQRERLREYSPWWMEEGGDD
ncbi:MAG TPA: Spy/CpxP family protein refolding chaperone [Casimicrobiaceae bacterium]|nr:Spy/CpxP family protein refolding chaperone [Casimicrobiaceae bacterium]